MIALFTKVLACYKTSKGLNAGQSFVSLIFSVILRSSRDKESIMEIGFTERNFAGVSPARDETSLVVVKFSTLSFSIRTMLLLPAFKISGGMSFRSIEDRAEILVVSV